MLAGYIRFILLLRSEFVNTFVEPIDRLHRETNFLANLATLVDRRDLSRIFSATKGATSAMPTTMGSAQLLTSFVLGGPDSQEGPRRDNGCHPPRLLCPTNTAPPASMTTSTPAATSHNLGPPSTVYWKVPNAVRASS